MRSTHEASDAQSLKEWRECSSRAEWKRRGRRGDGRVSVDRDWKK